MTFEEREGLPYLKHYTYIERGQQVSLKISRKGVLFRKATVSDGHTADSFVTHRFRKWIREHKKSTAKYNLMPLSKRLSEQEPIPLARLTYMVEALGEKRENGKERSFGLVLPTLSLMPELVWFAPIRTRPKRTYDEVRLNFSPEGTHTPYLIRKILDSKTKAQTFQKLLQNIGKSSGLFESIEIRQFGKSATSPFELDIVIDKKALNISTVGYGVSQALPVIVEILERPEHCWFAIQQPEIHLHPKAQAALGDLFFQLAVLEKKQFLIETHSDATIDRFRLNYRRGRKNRKKPDAQILFFERKNNANKVTPLNINERGGLPSKQPDSYRRFFIREQMRLLGL
jgi:hypothetical protein